MIEQYIDNDPEVLTARYVLAFMKALARGDDFLMFDAERLARLDPETIRAVEHLAKSIDSFYSRMKCGSGLRLVGDDS